MAWSLIPLTSCKQTPKWDHGLRVTPGGQPKQHYAKRRNLRLQTSQEERRVEWVFLFKSQLITKLDWWKV